MFPSKLNESSAITVGLATAAAVYSIYSSALPNMTDIRASASHNEDVDKERKAAAVKSAAVISVVFLISRDLNAYIIGGLALVGVDYMYKHSNGVNPNTGKLDVSSDGQSVAPGLAVAYPMPTYSADDEAM